MKDPSGFVLQPLLRGLFDLAFKFPFASAVELEVHRPHM